MNFDFWYGDKLEDVTGATVTFYSNDGIYKGNIYKDGKVIGDFSCKDSVVIAETFSEIFLHKTTREGKNV